MIVALYVSTYILLLTNPPQIPPLEDTGRRFNSMEACQQAMDRYVGDGTRTCLVLPGMI